MTRKQALDKAAAMLSKAEVNTLSDNGVGKYLNLAQMYLALAHEMNEASSTAKNEV
jgi:hypothetical protein